MSDPIDLGRPFACIASKRLDETAAFYQKLGFGLRPDDPPVPQVRALRQGTTTLCWLDFLNYSMVNYRGASIHAMATELASRGFQCWGLNHRGPEHQLFLDGEGDPLPDNEAGSFTIVDPDGYHIFFNTHPYERELYETNFWPVPQAYDGTLRNDDHMAAELEKGPDGATLGRFIYQIGVKDLHASRDFYERMGLRCENAAGGTFDVTGQQSHMLEDPTAFPIRLRRADAPGVAFLFRSDDPATVADSLRVDVEDGPEGPTMTDPNGQKVVLVSA